MTCIRLQAIQIATGVLQMRQTLPQISESEHRVQEASRAFLANYLQGSQKSKTNNSATQPVIPNTGEKGEKMRVPDPCSEDEKTAMLGREILKTGSHFVGPTSYAGACILVPGQGGRRKTKPL